MKGVSLFSSAGIGEAYLKDIGINIVVANELLEKRANLYKKLYPETEVIIGNILEDKIYKQILKKSGDQVDFLLATPPCQGMSIAGKNRDTASMMWDERNYLIFRAIDFIEKKSPNYVLIENVPTFLKLVLPYKGKQYNIVKLFEKLFNKKYNIEANILDSSEYGVPQKRKRAIVKLYKKGLKWNEPQKTKKISVQEAIGNLPSLEAGESSDIKWHFARPHTEKQILCMKNTPTGKTAFDNKKYRPVKDNGESLKGYFSTYRRIKWDEPSPAITIRNDAISSQRNVHPGRKLSNGEYSDARVLTPLELMILSSLPKEWKLPDDTPELLIRKCLGESIPPLLTKKILLEIKK